MSARAYSAAAGAGGSGAGGSGGGGGEGGEDVPPVDEPFVARASRIIWGSIKFAVGTALFGGVLYAGYSIIVVLLPVGTSSNSIMRKASDIVEHDPEVLQYFGSVKTYGIDLGGRAEGRRFFVPEYKYEDEFTGERFVDPMVTCWSCCAGILTPAPTPPPPPPYPPTPTFLVHPTCQFFPRPFFSRGRPQPESARVRRSRAEYWRIPVLDHCDARRAKSHFNH